MSRLNSIHMFIPISRFKSTNITLPRLPPEVDHALYNQSNIKVYLIVILDSRAYIDENILKYIMAL